MQLDRSFPDVRRVRDGEIESLRREIERLRAYIDGVQTASRRQPRIVINCKEVSKP